MAPSAHRISDKKGTKTSLPPYFTSVSDNFVHVRYIYNTHTNKYLRPDKRGGVEQLRYPMVHGGRSWHNTGARYYRKSATIRRIQFGPTSDGSMPEGIVEIRPENVFVFRWAVFPSPIRRSVVRTSVAPTDKGAMTLAKCTTCKKIRWSAKTSLTLARDAR